MAQSEHVITLTFYDDDDTEHEVQVDCTVMRGRGRFARYHYSCDPELAWEPATASYVDLPPESVTDLHVAARALADSVELEAVVTAQGDW